MPFVTIPPGTLLNANAIGLGISNTNLYKPNFDAITQSIENLKFLLLTHVGEIPLVAPNFGSKLLFILFESNSSSSDLKESIDDIIKTAVAAWLPNLTIEQIEITTSEDDITLSHDIIIKLTISFNELLTDTAVVEIAANNSGTIIVSSRIGS